MTPRSKKIGAGIGAVALAAFSYLGYAEVTNTPVHLTFNGNCIVCIDSQATGSSGTAGPAPSPVTTTVTVEPPVEPVTVTVTPTPVTVAPVIGNNSSCGCRFVPVN